MQNLYTLCAQFIPCIRVQLLFYTAIDYWPWDQHGHYIKNWHRNISHYRFNKRWTLLTKVHAIPNAPRIKITEKCGIHVSPLNTITSKYNNQTVCKWRAEPKEDENIKICEGSNGTYSMFLAKQAFHVPAVPVKSRFSCVQECVKIAEEGMT